MILETKMTAEIHYLVNFTGIAQKQIKLWPQERVDVMVTVVDWETYDCSLA
jgi:hypothetical protein